jgi:SAM-dependent methyltransferase
LNQRRIFDEEHYERLNSLRGAVVTRLVSELKSKLGLRTALDMGCGLGHFSGLLDSQGLAVTGVDGRKENVEEAQRRFPKIAFHHGSLEDPAIAEMGKFDLVLCLGLLYHLENPLLAIRNLQRLTARVLLAESVIFPGKEPLMGLVDEAQLEDQGLNYVAFYPTESCLVKMMYRAGMPHVYRVSAMPDHADFSPPRALRRVRTFLVASTDSIGSASVVRMDEAKIPFRPWVAEDGQPLLVRKVLRLARKGLGLARKPLR